MEIFNSIGSHFKGKVEAITNGTPLRSLRIRAIQYTIPKGRFGLTGPYGPVPGLDVSGKMVNIEDDEYNPVNFFDGIDRTHVRSMRNRKIPFSGGLAGIAGSDSYRRSRLSDEESGHFPQQIPVKFKRFGYNINFFKTAEENDEDNTYNRRIGILCRV